MYKEKKAEAIAVNVCVVNGYCDKCKYLIHCQSEFLFVFPGDAICTRIKNKIIKTLDEE